MLSCIDNYFLLTQKALGRHRQNRGIAIWLCLSAICLLLTACGDSRQSGDVGAQGASSWEVPAYVPEGREVVWIGTGVQSFMLADAVAGFNKSNDAYWAEVITYGEEVGGVVSSSEQEPARKRIQIAMTIGTECPDLMFIDSEWMNVRELAEQGYFEDLTPYLEESDSLSAEDFLDGIPEAYTCNGSLITLPCYFWLELLAGRKSQLEQFDSWTSRDMFAYGEQYPESILVECYDVPGYTLLTYGELLRLYEMPPFVTEEKGRRIVDREMLAAFLEKIERDSQQSTETLDDYPANYSENHILLSQMNISWLWDIQSCRAMFEGDEAYVGYPLEDGRNNIKIASSDLYGIPHFAGNKEGAWAFLEYYLSLPQDSHNIFPSRKDAFETALQRDMLHEGYEVNDEGILVLSGTNNSMMQSYHKGWEFSPGEIRQEDAEIAKELISRAGHPFTEAYTEMTWLKIMAEESGAYFTGQKSLQDVVDIIAVRLQIYLDETAPSDSAENPAE